jgi:hypothetical protein
MEVERTDYETDPLTPEPPMSETKEVRYPRRWKCELAMHEFAEQREPGGQFFITLTNGDVVQAGGSFCLCSKCVEVLDQHPAAAAEKEVDQPAEGRGDGGEWDCDTFLLYFEDADRGVEVYTDHAAAIRAYSDACMNWGCHLFQRVKSSNGTAFSLATHAPQAATGEVPFVGKVGPVLKLSCCLSQDDVAQVEKLLSDYAALQAELEEAKADNIRLRSSLSEQDRQLATEREQHTNWKDRAECGEKELDALAAERDGLREEVKKWKNETEFNFRLMKKCSTELEQARAKLDRVENALVRTPGADVGDEAYRICRELGATREALRKILIEVRCLWQQAESRHNSYRKLEELPEGHATGDAYRFALAALSPAAEAKKPDEDKIDELMQRVANTGHLATEPPKEWIADRTFADDERVTPVVERDDESPYWLAGALKPDVSVVPSANYDALKLELAGIREEDERLTQLYANVMIQNEALQAEIVALRQQLTAAESALAEANERKSLNERIGGDFMGIIELAMNTECFGNTPEEKTDKLLTEWMLIRRERDDLKQANAALAKEVERLKGVVEESEHVSKILACENRVLIGASNEGACRSLRHGSPLVLLWILETEKLRLIEKVEEQTSLASAALADAKGVG